ncbi:hypothetical protein RI129_007518 [Pyrocoelia pectoralis]|uniref:Cytochrome P450 n=1 Tax=Pyrocoelia pectoralis TaxID=417401 RepID=A0AAN7ZLI0_9COLE
MVAALLIIWSGVVIFWYWYHRRHLVKLGSLIPGPVGYPLIGNGLTFWGKPEEVFRRLREIFTMYTRLVAIWLGPKLHIALFDANDAEVVMRSKAVEKAEEYKYLKPWLGESLLISTGSKFRLNKKLIMPSFHVNNLKRFLDVFNDHSLVLVESLREKVGEAEFDIQPHLSTCTINVLLETVMGINKETLGDQAPKYSQYVQKLARLAHMRVYKFWLRPDIIFRFSKIKKEQDKYIKIVHGLTEKVIKERKKRYESRIQDDQVDEKWTVFMDSLLRAKDENGVGLTDEDIKAEVMTMMFAGQDTTSTTVGFSLSLLGIYQDIQDKVVEELDKVLGNSNKPITFEDMQNLQYLEQVVQETLRLYPPVPLVAKKPVADIQLDNYTIPANCTVGIMIMGIQRDPKQFPNPMRFNPDNFLPEKIKARHPYSFIPFSAGTRMCVGSKYATMLIKVILAMILRSYRVHATRREREFKLAGQMVLKRCDGFPVSLQLKSDTTSTSSIS